MNPGSRGGGGLEGKIPRENRPVNMGQRWTMSLLATVNKDFYG